MSTDVVDGRERFYKAQERAQAKACADRLALTEGKGNTLEHLVPPLYDDNLTPPQVVEYLGISRGTLSALTRIHREELTAAGYKYTEGAGSAMSQRFSRRSLLHLAILLRPNASEQSVRIKKALGISVAMPTNGPNRWAGHVTYCRSVLGKATELAEAIQESDPVENWNDLCQMDRYTLQTLLVALGTLVPLDQDGLFSYLAQLGDKVPVADRTDRADHGKQGHVARGLATLIPATRSEYEASEL